MIILLRQLVTYFLFYNSAVSVKKKQKSFFRTMIKHSRVQIYSKKEMLVIEEIVHIWRKSVEYGRNIER